MNPMLNIAIKAARSAGDVICREYGRRYALKIEEKTAAWDLVTNVDREVERLITATIFESYPKHNILGEENGMTDNGGDVCWIIDPIDGTYNFIRGIPDFAVSIAISISGVVQHAVVYNPISDDQYIASRGRGTQLNNRKIRVSSCNSLEKSLLAMGMAFENKNVTYDDYMKHAGALFRDAAAIRTGGAASLELAQVASGSYDGYCELGVEIWDIAAGNLLVTEAGGYVSNYAGDLDITSAEKGVIAASPKVHGIMLSELRHVVG